MGSWDDALLINWFHILKIFMDLYTIYAFFKRMKMQNPSSPLVYLSSYITLLIYFLGLFLYTNKLPENIGINQILLLAVYVVSDWLLLLFSWTIQLNIVARRDELFRFKANKIEIEKKQDDMFDVRYLPEEYMSDIQEESDEDDEDETNYFENPDESASKPNGFAKSPKNQDNSVSKPT